MAQKIIKLTESEFKKLISESVRKIIKEGYMFEDDTPEKVVAQIDEFVSKGRDFAFDMSDYVDEQGDSYGYIQLGYDPEKNILYGGGVVNAGVIHDFEMPYDLSLSLNDNVQNFYEQITEQLMQQGYFPQD